MNTKIKNYVGVLFSDIPRSTKAIELKEEMLANLNEYYAEYIEQGSSENQAYTQALSTLGDVDGLLESLRPDENFKSRLNYYKRRNALCTAISVTLYIIAVAVIIAIFWHALTILWSIKKVYETNVSTTWQSLDNLRLVQYNIFNAFLYLL